MIGSQISEARPAAQPAYVPGHVWRLAQSVLPEERAVWPVAADPVADRLAGYWQGQANAAPLYLCRSATSQDWPARKVLINR